MTTLMQQIKIDQVQARKDRDIVKGSVLTTLIGEAAMVGKNDGDRETTDVEVVAVIKKFIKNIDETTKVVKDNTVLLYERDVLQRYLPQQLSDTELSVIVGAIVTEVQATSPKDMGKVMKVLKDRYDGQYDGGMASKAVKQALGA